MQLSTIQDIDLDIEEFYSKASYLESYIQRIGDKVIVGYLAHDNDPQDPLEDDGAGSIYSSHRDSSTHSEMQDALGLDRDWNRDLSLVDDFPVEFWAAWIAAAVDSAEFHLWCERYGRVPFSASEPELVAYYRRKAVRYWRACDAVCWGGMHLDDFAFTDVVREQLWGINHILMLLSGC